MTIRLVTRNPQKIKKNILIGKEHYENLSYAEKFLNSIDDFDVSSIQKMRKLRPYQLNSEINKLHHSGFVTDALKSMVSDMDYLSNKRFSMQHHESAPRLQSRLRSVTESIKQCYRDIRNMSVSVSRSMWPAPYVEFSPRLYHGPLSVNLYIKILPALRATTDTEKFMSPFWVVRRSEKYGTHWVVGASSFEEEVHETMGDIRFCLLAYFRTTDSERPLGVQYKWMCQTAGFGSPAVGLGGDPDDALKSMIRDAAKRVRTHIKKSNEGKKK